MRTQRRLRSDCAKMRSLTWILTECILDSQRCIVSLCGQRRFWSDCANVQADLSLRWAHVRRTFRSRCDSFGKSHRMTKPTKWHVRPAKTQISLGVRPVWSESLLCAQWVAKDPSFLNADSEDWSDWAKAKADLSLHWAHMPFCWICHALVLKSVNFWLSYAAPWL